MEQITQNQDTIQLSVSISKQLHTAIKISAVQRGIHLKDVVSEGMSQYLDSIKQVNAGAVLPSGR